MQDDDEAIAAERDASDPDAAEGEGLFDTDLPVEPGLHLMQRHDVEAAIGPAYGGTGEWEDGEATSREDAARKKMLARYRDDPDALWRRCLVANAGTLARLRGLVAGAGNMVQAIEVIRRAAVISRHTGMSLRVPPLILVGPPGTGKSRITGQIASALGTSSRTIAGTSLQDTGPLTGYGPAWRGAGPGIVAQALLACPTASPVIVIDEAEKVTCLVEGRANPLDCLLPLLEPTTAAAFRDNYFDVPMRADHVIWVFAANSLVGLSRPLLDRCLVVEVGELSGAARRTALEELVVDVVLDHGIVPAGLDDESLAVLDGIGLRRAKAVVSAALAVAIEAGRDWPTAADLRAAATLLGDERPRRARQPAGFIHF